MKSISLPTNKNKVGYVFLLVDAGGIHVGYYGYSF
jgi:hypothetical protein